MKHTKEEIDKLGMEIVDLCVFEMYCDTSVYFNNKRICIDSMGNANEPEYDMNPKNYFKYAADKHILSMSFEGRLYDLINDYGEATKLLKFLEKYGLYYEVGNSWNLTVYPKDDIENWEYTKYEDEPDPEIIRIDEAPYVLKYILEWWEEDTKKTGDIGSCVRGAGIEFTYGGTKYFLLPPESYQCSMSWEHGVQQVINEMRKLGCTNVRYNCGVMD